MMADEIVVIVHNSTDSTLELVRKYPVTVIPYSGPNGIVSARLEGLRHVSGSMVMCIDGDSAADDRWIERMSELLQAKHSRVLVGSWVRFQGTLLGSIGNYFNAFLSNKRGIQAAIWIWGPSMAFWKKDIGVVDAALRQSVIVSQELGLSRNPDDYWLALSMSMVGDLAVTNKTHVTMNTKERTSAEFWKRNRENVHNAGALFSYFKKMRKV